MGHTVETVNDRVKQLLSDSGALTKAIDDFTKATKAKNHYVSSDKNKEGYSGRVILQGEPLVIADVHGNLSQFEHALLPKLIEHLEADQNNSVVVNGDLIGSTSGAHWQDGSFELFVNMMVLSEMYSGRVHILKGNHDLAAAEKLKDTNRDGTHISPENYNPSGCMTEGLDRHEVLCSQKKETCRRLYNALNELPVVAIAPGAIIAHVLPPIPWKKTRRNPVPIQPLQVDSGIIGSIKELRPSTKSTTIVKIVNALLDPYSLMNWSNQCVATDVDGVQSSAGLQALVNSGVSPVISHHHFNQAGKVVSEELQLLPVQENVGSNVYYVSTFGGVTPYFEQVNESNKEAEYLVIGSVGVSYIKVAQPVSERSEVGDASDLGRVEEVAEGATGDNGDIDGKVEKPGTKDEVSGKEGQDGKEGDSRRDDYVDPAAGKQYERSEGDGDEDDDYEIRPECPVANTSSKPKYLMIDHGGVLDGVQSRSPGRNDLVLSGPFEGNYMILMNGVTIVNNLNELVTRHGYQVVFHSKNREDQQQSDLRNLNDACALRNLTFPKVIATGVYNTDKYPLVCSAQPTIEENAEHGFRMACWGADDLDGKASLRRALECMLSIEEGDRGNHVVFDDGLSIPGAARSEGYQAYLIGEPKFGAVTLNMAVQSVLDAARAQEVETHSEEQNPHRERLLKLREALLAKNDWDVGVLAGDKPAGATSIIRIIDRAVEKQRQGKSVNWEALSRKCSRKLKSKLGTKIGGKFHPVNQRSMNTRVCYTEILSYIGCGDSEKEPMLPKTDKHLDELYLRAYATKDGHSPFWKSGSAKRGRLGVLSKEIKELGPEAKASDIKAKVEAWLNTEVEGKTTRELIAEHRIHFFEPGKTSTQKFIEKLVDDIGAKADAEAQAEALQP